MQLHAKTPENFYTDFVVFFMSQARIITSLSIDCSLCKRRITVKCLHTLLPVVIISYCKTLIFHCPQFHDFVCKFTFAPFIFARYNLTVWQMHLIKSLTKKSVISSIFLRHCTHVNFTVYGLNNKQNVLLLTV